jgi:hypothetical protein
MIPRVKPHALRALLAGGDRRSIARSNEFLALVLADRRLVAEVARLVADDDWLVAMRAIDLMEKLAHERPAWIARYRKLFIGPLAEHESWEIRLQIARALPLLPLAPPERRAAIGILRRYVSDPQKFVKAWALESLARFAEHDASLLPAVNAALEEFERSGSRSLTARARQIRKRLRA